MGEERDSPPSRCSRSDQGQILVSALCAKAQKPTASFAAKSGAPSIIVGGQRRWTMRGSPPSRRSRSDQGHILVSHPLRQSPETNGELCRKEWGTLDYRGGQK